MRDAGLMETCNSVADSRPNREAHEFIVVPDGHTLGRKLNNHHTNRHAIKSRVARQYLPTSVCGIPVTGTGSAVLCAGYYTALIDQCVTHLNTGRR